MKKKYLEDLLLHYIRLDDRTKAQAESVLMCTILPKYFDRSDPQIAQYLKSMDEIFFLEYYKQKLEKLITQNRFLQKDIEELENFNKGFYENGGLKQIEMLGELPVTFVSNTESVYDLISLSGNGKGGTVRFDENDDVIIVAYGSNYERKDVLYIKIIDPDTNDVCLIYFIVVHVEALMTNHYFTQNMDQLCFTLPVYMIAYLKYSATTCVSSKIILNKIKYEYEEYGEEYIKTKYNV